jgi:uncharacterized membrane protein YfcA
MAYLIVGLTAFLAAALTLFSGFGLGTLLLPVLALFFPIEVAVAGTAVVHLLNNLFKLALIGKDARLRVVLTFGVPAALAAMAGAWLLTVLAGMPVLLRYQLWGHEAEVTSVRLVVAALIFAFAVADLMPGKTGVALGPRWMPLGGLLSGLFGGLSGHQGALRSVFLIRAGLTKEEFVGTSATIAVMVDLSRIAVYGVTLLAGSFRVLGESGGYALLAVGTASAFAGSFAGTRLVKKVTLVTLQHIVGALLLVVAVAMGSGWI